MSTIYTVEGNTSGGSTLVANGGCVAKKTYASDYGRIAKIWRPNYKSDEALKVAQEAIKYVGYLEKKSNKNLEDFSANAGYNNYNMFAPHALKETGSKVYVNGVAWCDIFVDDMLIRALGKVRASALLGGWSAYTPTSSEYLKNAGAADIKDFSKSQYGDIIFFKNTKNVIFHTGIIVTGAENIKQTPAASIAYRQSDFIADVLKITGQKTAKKALAKTVTISREINNKHAFVLPIQKYLKTLGYYTGAPDKDFGPLTEQAVNLYQKNVLKYKIPDGEVTKKEKMWKSLLGLL